MVIVLLLLSILLFEVLAFGNSSGSTRTIVVVITFVGIDVVGAAGFSSWVVAGEAGDS